MHTRFTSAVEESRISDEDASAVASSPLSLTPPDPLPALDPLADPVVDPDVLVCVEPLLDASGIEGAAPSSSAWVPVPLCCAVPLWSGLPVAPDACSPSPDVWTFPLEPRSPEEARPASGE
jgi:hypothetical protein